MHILLIHQAYVALNEPGGTRHHEIARYLASHGHRVTVIASPVSYLTGKANPTPNPSLQGRGENAEKNPVQARGKRKGFFSAIADRQEMEGVTIIRSYTYPALHRSFVHRFISFISFMLSSFVVGLGVRQVDVVWGTSPQIFQGATAWALARLKRARFVFEVRDLWPAFAVAVGALRQPLLIKASEWLERFLYTHADQVVVNSPGFIQHVAQRGAHQAALVPNGADPGMFDPSARGEAFRAAHGLEGKFVILYAGAHGVSNDLEVVLEAARQTQGQGNIQFVLLGDGKEKAALVQHAAEMGLGNVTFIPSIPKTEMSAALAASDACIAILKPIPMYATVYPNKVFDYMAAGRPVILAIEGVIRQVVEEAQAGIAVPPGSATALADAACKLASDAALCRQMGQSGRSFVEQHFDRSVLAGEMEKIFTSR